MELIIICTYWQHRQATTKKMTVNNKFMFFRPVLIVLYICNYSCAPKIGRCRLDGWLAQSVTLPNLSIVIEVRFYLCLSFNFSDALQPPVYYSSWLHLGHFIWSVLEIWTINLNDFSLFMERIILMPIILMSA